MKIRPFSHVSLRKVLGAAIMLALGADALAATYTLPVGTDTVVGEVVKVVAAHEDTLLDIGRRNGVGYEEIVAANPGISPWLPGAGTEVLIPSRYILPDAPREGIVVSLSEHRLFYFPPHKPNEAAVVHTYPISVGRMDWHTPLGLTRIVNKREKPIWYPPESVRKEHADDGRPLPKAVPPGPDNPLGEYAMRLGIPGGAYLIHGTNKPSGVGMQVTHGCVRMYPEDIKALYPQVPVNTPVRLVDQPYKMGWRGDELYMEVHTPLEGADNTEAHSLTNITKLLVSATQDRPDVVSSGVIDWAKAERTFELASGVPEPVMLRPATVPATVQVINDTAGR